MSSLVARIRQVLGLDTKPLDPEQQEVLRRLADNHMRLMSIDARLVRHDRRRVVMADHPGRRIGDH